MRKLFEALATWLLVAGLMVGMGAAAADTGEKLGRLEISKTFVDAVKSLPVFNILAASVLGAVATYAKGHFAAGPGSRVQPYRRSYRFWSLVSYILPKKLRESFALSMDDLYGDFLTARRKHTGRGARAWLYFCWFVQAPLTFVETLRAGSISRLVDWLMRLFTSRLG